MRHHEDNPAHSIHAAPVVADTGPVAQLALFDLDNTLLDREKAFALWTGHFLKTHGLAENVVPIIESADGDGYNPRELFFSELRTELGIKASVEESFPTTTSSIPRGTRRSRGVIEAIGSLRAEGFKVGVVTNGPPSQGKKLLAAGIEDEFDAVCVSQIVGTNKPDLAIFEEVARICELPLRGWMVGDSPEADVAGGIAAGLRKFGCTEGENGAASITVPTSAPPDTQAVEIILRST